MQCMHNRVLLIKALLKKAPSVSIYDKFAADKTKKYI